MKKTILLFALITGSVLALSSCSKKGCTDSDAVNYCDKCKNDDGSCAYEGHVTVWWGKTVSDSLQAYGVTSVTVYVDGTAIDSKGTNIYWTGTPAYASSGSISAKKDLGSAKTSAGTVMIKDQSGNVIVNNDPFTWDKAKDASYEMVW